MLAWARSVWEAWAGGSSAVVRADVEFEVDSDGPLLGEGSEVEEDEAEPAVLDLHVLALML